MKYLSFRNILWTGYFLLIVVSSINGFIEAVEIVKLSQLSKETELPPHDIFTSFIPDWLGVWNFTSNVLSVIAVFFYTFYLKPIRPFNNLLFNRFCMIFIVMSFVITPFYECSHDSCTDRELSFIWFVTFFVTLPILRALDQLPKMKKSGEISDSLT